MEQLNISKLENTAYALTVNLFSFFKTSKEAGVVLANSQEMMQKASDISSFVLDRDGNECKYMDKLNAMIEDAEDLKEQFQNMNLSEKYASEKANLLIDINIIIEQFKALLG